MPSQSVAIKMQDLTDVYHEKDELRFIQNMIMKVKDNEKSKLKRYNIDLPRYPQN